MTQLACIAD